MRAIAPALLLMALILPAARAAEEDPAAADPQKQTAIDYFQALTAGDVERADALVAVPFDFDGKKVLSDIEEVKALHRKVLEDKGKREIPEYSIERTMEAKELDGEIFARYAVYRVLLEFNGRKQGVDIYISEQEPFRVIGVRD